MNVYVIERYTGEGGHWRFSANWSCFGVAMTPEGALQIAEAAFSFMRITEWERVEYENESVQFYRATIRPLGKVTVILVRVVEWTVRDA